MTSRIEDAERLLAAGALDEAATAFRAALHARGMETRAFSGLAKVAQRRGDRLAAIAALAKALGRAPGAVGVRLALAEELRRAGALAEAEAHYRAVLVVRPANPTALVGLARCIETRGGREEALRLAEQALEAVPGKEAVRQLVAQLKTGTRRPVGGVGTSEPARPATSAGATLKDARRLALAGQVEEAIALARTALRGGPADVEPLMLIASLEERSGRPHDAIATLEALLAMAPEHWPAQLHVAQIHKKAEALDRHVAALRRAHDIAPHEPEVALACADLLREADRHDAARDLVRLAVVKRPGDTKLLIRLATALAEEGEFDQALQVVQWEGDHGGDQIKLLRLRARILGLKGDYSGAAALLAPVAGAKPANPTLELELVRALILAGDIVQARARIARLPDAERWTSARRYILEGDMAVADGRIAEAVAAFDRAAAREPNNIDAQGRLCLCAVRTLDVQRLARHVRRFGELSTVSARLRGLTKAPRSFHARILNEFQIEPDLVSAVVATRSHIPAGDLSPLGPLLRDYPGHLAPALEYVGRRWPAVANSGAPPAAVDAIGSPIPRRIGQFWDAAVPPDLVRRALQSWDGEEGFAHVVFHQASALAFIRERFGPDHVRAYRVAQLPAHKADLLRLCWLASEGGIWIDADDVRASSIARLLTPQKDLVVYREPHGTFCNNVVAAVAGHPAIALALERAVGSILAKESDTIWLSTGPGLLTRAVAAWHADAVATGSATRDRVQVWEAHQLGGIVAMHRRFPHKRGGRHWRQSQEVERAVDLSWLTGASSGVDRDGVPAAIADAAQ